jgi:hypothetical protein
MTATAVANNAALQPMGEQTGMPGQLSFPLKASAQVGKLQFILIDPTSGMAFLADDATPGQIAGGFGFPDELSETADDDGDAIARCSQRWAVATPSTVVGDGFSEADVAVPFYVADGNTPGKLSHNGSKNRSLGGLVIGLAQEGQTPVRIWPGPIAQLLARAALAVNAASAGLVAYPADGGATNDIGSTSSATSSLMIPRTKTHGVITSIEIVPSASLSATSGNDRTITVWKVDTLGVASPVSVGTFTTTTALVAQTAAAFTLTATAADLNLLETDMLTYSTVHASAGAVIPQSAIRVNMKVN